MINQTILALMPNVETCTAEFVRQARTCFDAYNTYNTAQAMTPIAITLFIGAALLLTIDIIKLQHWKRIKREHNQK